MKLQEVPFGSTGFGITPIARCPAQSPDVPILPLHRDSGYTFRFADDRRIPRFHLDGVPAGRRVTVFALDPATGERRGVLAKATVGDGGWVDLAEPLVVRGGEFVAVPAPPFERWG